MMPQAQFSTQEQLEWLRSFYQAQVGCVCCPKSATELIRLANTQGLYDAADHVQRKYDAGARLPEKLMEW